jgi:hypothetical protein
MSDSPNLKAVAEVILHDIDAAITSCETLLEAPAGDAERELLKHAGEIKCLGHVAGFVDLSRAGAMLVQFLDRQAGGLDATRVGVFVRAFRVLWTARTERSPDNHELLTGLSRIAVG